MFKMPKVLKLSFVPQKAQSLRDILAYNPDREVEEPPSPEIFQDFTLRLICYLHELKSLVVSYSSGPWHVQDTALRSVDSTAIPETSTICISSKNMTDNTEQEKIGIWQGDLQVATQQLEREGGVICGLMHSCTSCQNLSEQKPNSVLRVAND